MSDVLIGQSYFLRFDPKLWGAMQPYPPLGSLYAASVLRREGYGVALFDAMLAESEEDWDQKLQTERPQFAVVYEDNFNYLSKMCLLRMREAAFKMIEMAGTRGCTVIVSGSDATDHSDMYLKRGAHFVLVGEGEQTLVELLEVLSGRTQKPYEEVLGLAFHASDAADGHTCTVRRPDIRDLDSLPFPAWDLVDVEKYRAIWVQKHGYYSMNMVTTRGCPYHCNWCAKPIWGQRYNSRSPENVVEELKWLKDTYQPDHIWYADDIMGLKPRWMDRYADLVEQHDASVPFKSLQRADLILRGTTIEALKRAGAEIVWIGAESGSQKILDAMEKGTKIEHIHQAAQRLHQAGIKVGFFLQFGYPGETRADIERTLQMVRDCRPDDIGASVSYPLPGTKFYQTVQRQLGNKQNWTDSNDLEMLYEGPFRTVFYRQLHTVLHKEFRARTTWDELQLALRNPFTIQPGHLRSLKRTLYHRLTLPFARHRLERLASPPKLPGRDRRVRKEATVLAQHESD